MTSAQARYQQVYGESPVGLWAAPGRVNLIGEHTDYNEGFVLPFALPRRVTVAAAPTSAPVWTVWSASTTDGPVTFTAQDLVPGQVDGWAGYAAGAVWALREAGYDVPGAQLAIVSDVPLGAGLSSSAALVCAVLTTLADLGELDLPLVERPMLAHRAEFGYVGVPCGIMDQTASLLCQAGHALFLDCRSGETTQVPFDPAAAGLALLVIDTHTPHRVGAGEYADRRATCERAATALGEESLRDVSPAALAQGVDRLGEVELRRARHVVTENQRVLDTVARLRSGALREIGPLLSASHASLRDDFEVTVPQLDVAAGAAEQAGAWGARMTGAGFGGCVIALVEADAAPRVTGAVAVAFDRRGFAPPSAFVADPSRGAARLA